MFFLHSQIPKHTNTVDLSQEFKKYIDYAEENIVSF